MFEKVAGQIGPKQNRPQVKSAQLQISPKSNRPQIKSLYYYAFSFNLIICIVNCVVYLIPNQMIVNCVVYLIPYQIIVLLCYLFNLIICP
jgi:hypothetical protein